MEKPAATGAAPTEAPHWETTLRPHRSLPPGGFLALMLVLAAVSFVSGVIFVSIGAWPVCGFFGLDVLLVYFAFRLNYRSARQSERLRLLGDDFTVEKVSVRGERRAWRFQAFWLRIRLVERDAESNRLILSSHGRSLAVAGFLTAEQRRGLAVEIQGALDRWRTNPT